MNNIENEVLKESIKNLEYAKSRISELVDSNTKNAMKIQAIADLVLKYGKKLPKDFLKEFIEIAKN